MTKGHLKRIATPRSWSLERKTHPWAVRPRSGPHGLRESISLLHVVRDMLDYADTFKEAKKIINEGKVLVDGRIVRDVKRGIGLMDVIDIPLKKESFVVVVNKKGLLVLKSIKASEAKFKLLSLVNKTIVKGGRAQLNFHDGRNMIVETAAAKKFRVHDTVVLNLKDKSIKEQIKYENGATVFVRNGSHKGELAKIKDIQKTRSPMSNVVTLEGDGNEFRTIEDYIFVVGKDKPVLSVV